MGNGGIAALREDGFVILDHAEAGDLARDDLLEMPEGEHFALKEEMVALDHTLAEDPADAIDHRLGPRADRRDGLDFPRLLALARQLQEVFACTAIDRPSAPLHPLRHAAVEVEREVSGERHDCSRPELAQNCTKEDGARLAP